MDNFCCYIENFYLYIVKIIDTSNFLDLLAFVLVFGTICIIFVNNAWGFITLNNDKKIFIIGFICIGHTIDT